MHTTCISSGSTMVVALFQVLARQFRIRAAISGFLSWKRATRCFFPLYPFICHCTVPYAPLNFLVCYDNQSALRNLLIIMHVAMCHVVVKYRCSLSLSSSLNKFVFCMTYNRTNEYLSFLFFFFPVFICALQSLFTQLCLFACQISFLINHSLLLLAHVVTFVINAYNII